MRSIRYRVCLLVLAVVFTWSCYLFVIKSVNPRLAQLPVSPRSEVALGEKPEQLVYQKENVQKPLGGARVDPSAYEDGRLKRSTGDWSDTAMLLGHDKENSMQQKACFVPQINPFHDLAMREMQDVGVINCPNDGIGYVENGSLILKTGNLRYAHIQYIQRPPENDDDYFLSDAIPLIEPIKDLIRPGNLGCLVAAKRKILEFEDDVNVVSSHECTPSAFFELHHDGIIRNLHGKALTIQECSSQQCSLALSSVPENAPTRFSFQSNGQIKVVNSSKCLVFAQDEFDNFDELVLLENCQHPAAWWTMYHYPENDVQLQKPLTGDFIKLLLVQHLKCHTEYHAHVVPVTLGVDENRNLHNHDLLNVALFVLESQSAANIERKLPQVFRHINGAHNAFIFKGHTIVGDGTTDQLCAMLVGRLEEQLPVALRSSLNSVFVDNWPFIFEDFREKGYVTLFTEDDSRFPAFSYRLNGFRRPPTDHYARTFWQCATVESRDNQFCIGRKPYHKVSLDYTESFFDAYNKRPKLSVTILSAESHNNINNIQYIEGDFLQFLNRMDKRGYLNNTFVFILGDHGLRASAFRMSFAGWLEERLPFFAMLVPDAYLGGNVDKRQTIGLNTQLLTSHFDIYASLLDIINTYAKRDSAIGHSLLRPIDHAGRTCKSAGIGQHWCPCQSFDALSKPGRAIKQTAARAVVVYINTLVANLATGGKCANLVLEDIKHVSYTTKTAGNSVGGGTNQTDYLIVLSVLPSNGIYEASVTRLSTGDWIVDPNISRLDLYGNQPLCIARDHPSLRKFCYCSEFL